MVSKIKKDYAFIFCLWLQKIEKYGHIEKHFQTFDYQILDLKEAITLFFKEKKW